MPDTQTDTKQIERLKCFGCGYDFDHWTVRGRSVRLMRYGKDTDYLLASAYWRGNGSGFRVSFSF